QEASIFRKLNVEENVRAVLSPRPGASAAVTPAPAPAQLRPSTGMDGAKK
ncbi:MAG: hypothetical protein JWQ07_1205, partial [Ramlibacter sp.]|nr:hypothetical protein [Ramlibacter sp.]